jgi:HSP20 family molecular chaperone IbpA
MVYRKLSNYLMTVKRQKMTHTNVNYPGTNYTYPDEYIPAPLTLEELMAELQNPHEGEAKPMLNLAEMPDAFIIEVAAPGLKSVDFMVSIDENLLSIAVLHKEIDASNKLYHQHEFNHFLGVYNNESEKEKERNDFDNYACSLQRVFNESKMKFHMLERSSVIKTMETLDKKFPYDIMAMVRRKKHFLKSSS